MGRIVYHIFISVYPLIIRLASLFNKKAGHWVKGRKHQQLPIHIKNSIWFHCASLGEFEQARPLIESIKKSHPQHHIVLTFFSPSGYLHQKNYAFADDVLYLPMDSKKNALRFIEAIQPTMVFFIKYEYWYYYLKTLHQKQIPLFLVSGIFRKDQTFFKWYGGFFKHMLSYFTRFFLQDTASAKLLHSLGYENYTINGDTRFDRVVAIAKNFEPIIPVENFLKRSGRILVAGSTWIEDDKVLSHYANTHPEISFIIAPHEIHEARIEACRQLYKNAIRYSDLLNGSFEITKNNNVLIIDNIGMLSRLYYYADVCFIGGGYGGDGVHNVLEAAVYGKAIVHGPEYEKYREAVDLIEQKASFIAPNVLELEKILNDFFNNDLLRKNAGSRALKYIEEKKGASEKIIFWLYEKRLLTN